MISVDPIGRPLHSLEGRTQVLVNFYNVTSYTVSMFWFNYSGIRVHYGDIGPREFKLMDTYVTHPWEFVDRANGVTMMANDAPTVTMQLRGRSVAWHNENSRLTYFPRSVGNSRTTVYIYSDVYSLKKLAIKAVRDRIRRGQLRLNEEYVPETLIQEVTRPARGPGYLSLNEVENFR